jgi:hypothetical protein
MAIKFLSGPQHKILPIIHCDSCGKPLRKLDSGCAVYSNDGLPDFRHWECMDVVLGNRQWMKLDDFVKKIGWIYGL